MSVLLLYELAASKSKNDKVFIYRDLLFTYLSLYILLYMNYTLYTYIYLSIYTQIHRLAFSVVLV